MLPSYFYTDESIFEKEKKKIFFNQWLLFGLTQEFEGEGFYVRKTIIDQDVFVRKNGENYSAFYNCCPHRYHPIVTDSSGKTNLVCKYHYWSFKNNGEINGIPYQNECYQFTQKEFKKISLNKIAIKRIGSLLFINLSKKPIPFLKQFNEKLLLDIQSISSTFNQYHKVRISKKFNWKLIQENLRDGLHPIFLHKKTLLDSIDFGLPAIPKEIPIHFLQLKNLSFGGPDLKLTQIFPFQKMFNSPWKCEDRYYNYHLFPSCHLAAADGGYTFVIEKFIPTSPFDIEVELYFILTKNILKLEESEKLFQDLKNNALKVYEEDFTVLENIQTVIMSGCSTQYNGLYERLITRLHKTYLKLIGNNCLKWLIYVKDTFQIPFFLIRYFLKIN